MRRARLAPFALLALALTALLVSLPAAARTGAINADGSAECPDLAAAVDSDVDATQPAKPAAAKRSGPPAQGKARPPARGNSPAPARGPRWHRFLPGMIR
jgi:hypothetical protein